jgi:7-cyano-7-deazaguanine synthase
MADNLVLLSSGLDSAVNLLVALEEGGVGAAVTVDYGQRAACREVEKAADLCRRYQVRHIVLEASWLGEICGGALAAGEEPPPIIKPGELDDDALTRSSMKEVWVPNRNGLLANMGACLAEAMGLPWVVMGLNAEEGATFPDNSPHFMQEANRLFAYSTLSKIRLRSFTMDWDKVDIMRAAVECDLDFHLLWPCYNGETLMCGTCESCARFKRAAMNLGVMDRLRGLFESEREPDQNGERERDNER